ncbi:heterokaryon incompatibility domain-containing protein [Trichoderma austrokoningii]
MFQISSHFSSKNHTMSLSNKPRKEPHAQAPSEICHECSRYDFPAALATFHSIQYLSPRRMGYGIKIANVGKRYRTPFETNCSLCRLLLASRKSSLDLYPLKNEDEDDTDELRAFLLSAYDMFDDAQSTIFGPLIRRGNRCICIDVVSSKFPIDRKQRHAHGAKHGRAVICHPQLPTRFPVQTVLPYLDPGVARKWIDYCKDCHPATCSTQENASATNLNLIDCQSLVVEQGLPQAPPYVALSYVWGSPTACDQYSPKAPSGDTFSLPPILPAVILDAIAVTKSLGYRYLWVDKFCIDQVNNDVKHQQIAQMDSIYETAQVTIVAAAGSDETHGLPGVGSKRRPAQPIARTKKLTVLSTMRDVRDAIRSSKWFTRGWTFQEALLTRRRLVFTEEQVYFECAAMNCCESLPAVYRVPYLRRPRAGLFEISGWRNLNGSSNRFENTLDMFMRYLTAVEDYTPRQLSYQHDSLNAFAGIIKKFERAPHPIIQLWGIPTTIEYRYQAERYFVQGLCWNHAYSCWGHEEPRRPSRRPDFPSWSWAGWAGKVNYTKKSSRVLMGLLSSRRELRSLKHSISTLRVRVKISFESDAGQIFKISDMAGLTSIHGFDMTFFKVLQLRASVFPSSAVSYTKKSGWRLMGRPAVVSLSQGPESQHRFLEQLNAKDSGLQIIYVGGKDSLIYGLILETQGSGASSRVGLITAYQFDDDIFSRHFEQRIFRII